MRKNLGAGLLLGIDKSVWLWGVVPQGSVTDAKDEKTAFNIGRPIYNMYHDLADMAGRGNRRRNARGTYRNTHLLLINVPKFFSAPKNNPIRSFLDREFSSQHVIERILLFGVKLRPSYGSGTWRDAINSTVETLQYGGSPMSDYEKDRIAISSIFSRNGLSEPTEHHIRLADSWWNTQRNYFTPVLPHTNHMHYFDSITTAERLRSVNNINCSQWESTSSEHAVTFATLKGLDFGYIDTTDRRSRWATSLFDSAANVISVRANVEPASVTRNELRSQKKRYLQDLEDLAAEGKMDRQELVAKEKELDDIETAYSSGGPPTLTDASIVMGFSGVVEDISKVSPPGIELSVMSDRQPGAWHETMMCANIRSNPLTQDFPATVVAFSAIASLSRAGDSTGALLGFTERDDQPVYISPKAASSEDTYPLMAVYAASGAGKSVLLQHLAKQFDESSNPQLVVNPKQSASLDGLIDACGGKCKHVTLDEFVRSDGMLDPLRTIPNLNDAVASASSMVVSVNPFGPSVTSLATDIAYAIRYGADRGARATGLALSIARDHGVISPEIADPIFRFAEVYPMFRATFGLADHGKEFSLSDGLTLIEVGDTSFALPPTDFRGQASELQNPTVRTSMNVIRMLVWGGMAALRHRSGVLHLDESWIMEKAAPEDLDQIGRLARAWEVLPILYTQRPSGQQQIGLKGYISRGLIGHIKDENEARVALDMFGLGENVDYMNRITSERYLSDGVAANWDSLMALPNEAGGVQRGSVFYHVDIRGRVAPTEVRLSPSFLKLASTTPDEVRRRRGESCQ